MVMEEDNQLSIINAAHLAGLLNNCSSSLKLLLVDCRPLLAYNTAHIVSAVNALCPPLARKRHRDGAIPLRLVVENDNIRRRLVAGQYDTIVLYDEASGGFGDVRPDSLLMMTMRSLYQDAPHSARKLVLLQGGYSHFSGLCRSLCLSAASTPSVAHAPYEATPPSVSTFSSATPSTVSTERFFQTEPTELLPWLYLGNQHHARCEQQLSRLGITAVLNVSAANSSLFITTTPSSPSSFCKRLMYKRIPVDDGWTSDLHTSFPEAIAFIGDVREQGGKVLVHCQAGISRSATICIAYIMTLYGIGLDEAFDFVRARRSHICPHLNFMRQLQEFETQLAREAKTKQRRHTSPNK